jgi:7-cyano-7-deazaguanine synthase
MPESTQNPSTTDTADEPTGDQPTKRAVVLASGGMDSATTVYEARERGYDLYLLHGFCTRYIKGTKISFFYYHHYLG